MSFAWVTAFFVKTKDWPWKLIGLVALVAALVVVGYQMGSGNVQAKWDKEKANQAAVIKETEGKQQAVSVKVDEQHTEKQIQIQTVFKDRNIYITREVPHEVIVRQDSACVIPNRVVSLWNSANRGEVPDATSVTDESASAVVLSDITAQKEREAELALANEVKLTALQQWVREQQAITNGEKP